MVHMQVRTQHGVDAFTWKTRAAEILQKRTIAHIPTFNGALFVIPEARIDNDAFAVGLNNQRVNAQVTVCQPANKSFELAMLGLAVEIAPSAEADAAEPDAAEAASDTESAAAAPEEAA